MEFKEKIKAARYKLFMSQEEMAKALGVAFETVNRWENGKNEPNFKAQKAFHLFCRQYGIKFEE